MRSELATKKAESFIGFGRGTQVVSSKSISPNAFMTDGGNLELKRILQKQALHRPHQSTMFGEHFENLERGNQQLPYQYQIGKQSQTIASQSSTLNEMSRLRFNDSFRRAERYDVLNPQNQLSKLSLPQQLLGNASKVDFNVKTQFRKANLIQMADVKQPAKDKYCDHIQKILASFKKELYGFEEKGNGIQPDVAAAGQQQPLQMSSFMFSKNRHSKLYQARTTGYQSPEMRQSSFPYSQQGETDIGRFLKTDMSIKDRIQMYKQRGSLSKNNNATGEHTFGPKQADASSYTKVNDNNAHSTITSRKNSWQDPKATRANFRSLDIQKEQPKKFTKAQMKTLYPSGQKSANQWQFPQLVKDPTERFKTIQSAMDVAAANQTAYDSEKTRAFGQGRTPFDFDRTQISKSQMNRHYVDSHAVTRPHGWANDTTKLRRPSPLIATKIMKDMMALQYAKRQQPASNFYETAYSPVTEHQQPELSTLENFYTTRQTNKTHYIDDEIESQQNATQLNFQNFGKGIEQKDKANADIDLEYSLGDLSQMRPKQLSSQQTFYVLADPKQLTITSFNLNQTKTNMQQFTDKALYEQAVSKQKLLMKKRVDDKEFDQFQRLMIKYSDADYETPLRSHVRSQLKKMSKKDGLLSKSSKQQLETFKIQQSMEEISDMHFLGTTSQISRVQSNQNPFKIQEESSHVADASKQERSSKVTKKSPKLSKSGGQPVAPSSSKSADSAQKNGKILVENSNHSSTVRQLKAANSNEGSGLLPIEGSKRKNVEIQQHSFNHLKTESDSRHEPSQARLQNLNQDIPVSQKDDTAPIAGENNGISSQSRINVFANNKSHSSTKKSAKGAKKSGKKIITTLTTSPVAEEQDNKQEAERLFPQTSEAKAQKQRSNDSLKTGFGKIQTKKMTKKLESSHNFKSDNVSPSSGNSADDLNDSKRLKALALAGGNSQQKDLAKQKRFSLSKKNSQITMQKGRTHEKIERKQMQRINTKVIEMKQKKMQIMATTQGTLNQDLAAFQTQNSFKLDMPKNEAKNGNAQHLNIQQSDIISCLNTRDVISNQLDLLQQLTVGERLRLRNKMTQKKIGKKPNLTVQGATMQMSSFREWCQSQQDLYDQTMNQMNRKGMDSTDQATDAQAEEFLNEILDPQFNAEIVMNAEQHGSGTLLCSNKENEDQSFNIGTFQMNSKSELQMSKRQFGERLESHQRIQKMKQDMMEHGDGKGSNVLKEEMNGNSSQSSSQNVRSKIQFKIPRQTTSELESNMSIKDKDALRDSEQLVRRLIISNIDSADEGLAETDPINASAKNMKDLDKDSYNENNISSVIEQWEKTSLERKNSLLDHMIHKNSSQEILEYAKKRENSGGKNNNLQKGSKKKGVKAARNQQRVSNRVNAPAGILGSPKIAVTNYQPDEFDPAQASFYVPFDVKLQNSKYLRNLQRQMKIQEQQTERQNLSTINLEFTGKAMQLPPDQKYSRHIFELAKKQQLQEMMSQTPEYINVIFQRQAAPIQTAQTPTTRNLQNQQMSFDQWTDENNELQRFKKNTNSLKEADLTFGDNHIQQTNESYEALISNQNAEGSKVLIARNGSDPIANILQNNSGVSQEQRLSSEERDDISEMISVNTPFKQKEGEGQDGGKAAGAGGQGKDADDGDDDDGGEHKIIVFGTSGQHNGPEITILNSSQQLQESNYLHSLTNLKSVQDKNSKKRSPSKNSQNFSGSPINFRTYQAQLNHKRSKTNQNFQNINIVNLSLLLEKKKDGAKTKMATTVRPLGYKRAKKSDKKRDNSDDSPQRIGAMTQQRFMTTNRKNNSVLMGSQPRLQMGQHEIVVEYAGDGSGINLQENVRAGLDGSGAIIADQIPQNGSQNGQTMRIPIENQAALMGRSDGFNQSSSGSQNYQTMYFALPTIANQPDGSNAQEINANLNFKIGGAVGGGGLQEGGSGQGGAEGRAGPRAEADVAGQGNFGQGRLTESKEQILEGYEGMKEIEQTIRIASLTHIAQQSPAGDGPRPQQQTKDSISRTEKKAKTSRKRESASIYSPRGGEKSSQVADAGLRVKTIDIKKLSQILPDAESNNNNSKSKKKKYTLSQNKRKSQPTDQNSSTRTLQNISKLSHFTEKEEHNGEIQYRVARRANSRHFNQNTPKGIKHDANKTDLNKDLQMSNDYQQKKMNLTMDQFRK